MRKFNQLISVNINIHHKNRRTVYICIISQILLPNIPNTFMTGMLTHCNQQYLSNLCMISQLMSAMTLMAICHIAKHALTLYYFMWRLWYFWWPRETKERGRTSKGKLLKPTLKSSTSPSAVPWIPQSCVSRMAMHLFSDCKMKILNFHNCSQAPYSAMNLVFE